MDTKALRQKILDLAIRGKLVPQNPNDEPASVLLERIRQQKQQMVKEGKLKPKDIKNDSVIFVGEDNLHYEKFADGSVKCIEDEIPFELPESWAWARLQSFVNFIGGSQPPKSTFEYVATKDNIRLIQIRDYKTDKFLTYIPKSLARRFCSKGDVMIGRYGPPIFQVLRGLEGSYNVALMKAVSEPGIMLNDYLFYLLQDGELLKMLESLSDRTCGQDGINMYELNRYIVGIPPLDEQNRITQYLISVLPIVDNIASNKAELESLITQTKAKILDLAIRGQFVPQDPNDEPASVLLERIRAEKEELIKQGKIKRDKKESVIFRGEDNSYYLNDGTSTIDISQEVPFDIPDSWYWGKLKDIVMINPRNKLDDNTDVAFIPMPLIEDGYSGHHTSEIRKWKEVKTGFTHFQEGDVGVAKITPCFENRKSVIFENLNNGYGAGTTELYVFRPYGKTILPQYLLAYMKSAQFIENGKRTFAGVVGQQRVSKEYVENVYFPIPPIDEQKRIVHQLTIAFEYLNLISNALT